MGGDAVGTGRRCQPGRLDRVGVHAAARVPDGGDMIDVHAEAQITAHCCPSNLFAVACQGAASAPPREAPAGRSEEHTSELQSLMRISYAVFCLKKKKQTTHQI